MSGKISLVPAVAYNTYLTGVSSDGESALVYAWEFKSLCT